MISRIALVVFLISIGIGLIWALPYLITIAGIAAIIAGVAVIIER